VFVITKGLSRILVPVDFGAASRRAARAARSLAIDSGATVTIAHVMPGRGLRDADEKRLRGSVERALRQFLAAVRLPARTAAVVLRGNPASAVAQYAADEGIDLIVLSGRRKRAWDGAYLGGVALGILKHARVPVLVLPAHQARKRAAK
jgi:nucleotide-binding universal stress UspA family protein